MTQTRTHSELSWRSARRTSGPGSSLLVVLVVLAVLPGAALVAASDPRAQPISGQSEAARELRELSGSLVVAARKAQGRSLPASSSVIHNVRTQLPCGAPSVAMVDLRPMEKSTGLVEAGLLDLPPPIC